MFPKSFKQPTSRPSELDRLERSKERGFSLMELLVVMVVAVILGTVLVRFYKDTYRTYSFQEQVSDRNQTAHFVLSKLVEVLQQAGSSLPNKRWLVIRPPVTGVLMRIGVNPRGAEQFIGAVAASSKKIAVDSAALFSASAGNPLMNFTDVLLEFADTTRIPPTVKLTIDVNVNSGGFVAGIKDMASPIKDTICVTTSQALVVGDKIYGYREDEYALSGTDLVVRPDGSIAAQMVLAENIESIGIIFRTISGAATTSWTVMRSASVSVLARTETKDLGLSPPDYRRITLPMNVIMRNKI